MNEENCVVGMIGDDLGYRRRKVENLGPKSTCSFDFVFLGGARVGMGSRKGCFCDVLNVKPPDSVFQELLIGNLKKMTALSKFFLSV